MSTGRQRPTAVLVLGIVSIAFGVLGICGGLAELAGLLVGSRASHSADIPADVQLWLRLLRIVNVSLRVILLASGIGLMFMQGWARILSMVYAVLHIPVAIIATILSLK